MTSFEDEQREEEYRQSRKQSGRGWFNCSPKLAAAAAVIAITLGCLLDGKEQD